jgi:hypothetical protein
VIIMMLAISEPGKIRLLPALPDEWPSGTIEGVLCRGQVEIKSLRWQKDRVQVRLKSGKEQLVILELPAAIRAASVTAGPASVAETGQETSRKVALPRDQEVTIQIDLK